MLDMNLLHLNKYLHSTEISLLKFNKYLHKTDNILLLLDTISLQIFICRSKAIMLSIEASGRRTKDQLLPPEENDQNS